MPSKNPAQRLRDIVTPPPNVLDCVRSPLAFVRAELGYNDRSGIRSCRAGISGGACFE